MAIGESMRYFEAMVLQTTSNGSFELAADRTTAQHRYTQDGIEYVVNYEVQFKEFDEDVDTEGCTLSPASTPQSWLWCGLAWFVVASIKPIRRKPRLA